MRFKNPAVTVNYYLIQWIEILYLLSRTSHGATVLDRRSRESTAASGIVRFFPPTHLKIIRMGRSFGLRPLQGVARRFKISSDKIGISFSFN